MLTQAGFLLLGGRPILWVVSTTALRQTVMPPVSLAHVSAVSVMPYDARPANAAMAAWFTVHAGVGTCLVVATAGFALQLLCIV